MRHRLKLFALIFRIFYISMLSHLQILIWAIFMFAPCSIFDICAEYADARNIRIFNSL